MVDALDYRVSDYSAKGSARETEICKQQCYCSRNTTTPRVDSLICLYVFNELSIYNIRNILITKTKIKIKKKK